MSLIYIINGVKMEDIRFKHLDYYDALAEFARRSDAKENDAPWAYLREGSGLTLCSAVIDGHPFEGWAHRVPQDAPRRKKGNHLAMARLLKAAKVSRDWRELFWRTWFETSRALRVHEGRVLQQKIRLVKGASVEGEDVQVEQGTAEVTAEVPENKQTVGRRSRGRIRAKDEGSTPSPSPAM